MTGGSATFSVVPSRALRDLTKKDLQDQLSRSWSSAFTDDDSDAVTDLFHQRQQQFVYVRNCEVAVQYGGEALIHDEMPAAFFSRYLRVTCFSLFLSTTSKGSSSSHARWQGAARWKRGWNDPWKGWDDISATTSPISESKLDERLTSGLHMMQDHLPQTIVISQRRLQKTLSERSASKTKGNAACETTEAVAEARERQETRRQNERKCQDAGDAETIYSGAIQDTPEQKRSAWEHVKTVTMRAESLATTEADFFRTLFERQEETQRDLNGLSTQLSPDPFHTIRVVQRKQKDIASESF